MPQLQDRMSFAFDALSGMVACGLMTPAPISRGEHDAREPFTDE